jgi:hypothetical protein
VKTSVLDGAHALAALLEDAPDWLPQITHWELCAPTADNARHVMGQMPERPPGFQRAAMRRLAEEIGGIYYDEPTGGTFTSACVQFWYDGVLFTFWACVPVRAEVPA